jgi:hypothetical protein
MRIDSPFRLLLCLLLAISSLRADEGWTFFGLTNLWEIRLTLPAANWAAMTPHERDQPVGRPGPVEREYPWTTATFACDGTVLTNVAVRFKGNSSFNMSRNGLKRPFKLDFDRGAKGRTFRGHEELLLNNNLNDGTQFREALAYDVFRRAGLPTPRTAFARAFLTVTGERTNVYLGLYTVVEAVDGDFLKAQCGTKQGLLVKPERVPGLQYLGPDWAAYTNRFGPKTKPKAGDTERFIELNRLADQADDATFARELPRRMDLTNLFRFVAINALLANYDSFLGTGHNFYLFQPHGDAKAAFIPWDLNESFGGHPPGGSRREQAEFSVLTPHSAHIRFLTRVLARPEFAAAYRREVAGLLTNAFQPERLRADAARIANVTREAAFAESPRARAAFETAAPGATNRAPERSFAAGPGLGPREDMAFADWVDLRARQVIAELAGERTGRRPDFQRGPGGMRPPGQPRLGGPGGLVPPPLRDGERPRPPAPPAGPR